MTVKELLKVITNEHARVEAWVEDDFYGVIGMEEADMVDSDDNGVKKLVLLLDEDNTYPMQYFKEDLQKFDKNLEILCTKDRKNAYSIKSAKLTMKRKTKELVLVVASGWIECECK